MISTSCRAKCATLPRSLASLPASCYLWRPEGDAERAHGSRAGRLAQSPRRLQTLAVHRVSVTSRMRWQLSEVLRLAAVGSHTPHSGLLALLDGALTAQPCSRGVTDAIHGLGKADTKLYQRRVCFKHMPGISRDFCNTIRVHQSGWTTSGGAFPKDSAFSQGAHARTGVWEMPGGFPRASLRARD